MRGLPLALVALMVLAPITGASVFPAVDAVHAGDFSDGAVETEGQIETQIVSQVATENGATDNDTATNETGHVLSIPEGDVRRSTTGDQYADLGPAVTFGVNGSADRIETLRVIERIERTDDPDEREEQVDAEFERIETDVATLRDRERAAIDAYNAETLSTKQFLIELAEINAEAEEIEERRSRLAALVEDDDELALDRARSAAIERSIDAHTGPVRAHVEAVLRGQQAQNRFFVATGAESVVLATTVEGAYLREAFRGDRYSAGGSDIGPEAALDIAAESYPGFWETRQNNTDVTGTDGNYLVRIPHERGLLHAYVDGESESVYKEIQRRPLAEFEHEETVRTTRDGLQLTINHTYPGGPIEIRLVDAADETPVDANVTISEGGQESELLGRSGADGTILTLSPQTEYTITAIRGNDVVIATVQPREPPHAGG